VIGGEERPQRLRYMSFPTPDREDRKRGKVVIIMGPEDSVAIALRNSGRSAYGGFKELVGSLCRAPRTVDE
jgi:hypothetical protein